MKRVTNKLHVDSSSFCRRRVISHFRFPAPALSVYLDLVAAWKGQGSKDCLVCAAPPQRQAASRVGKLGRRPSGSSSLHPALSLRHHINPAPNPRALRSAGWFPLRDFYPHPQASHVGGFKHNRSEGPTTERNLLTDVGRER